MEVQPRLAHSFQSTKPNLSVETRGGGSTSRKLKACKVPNPVGARFSFQGYIRLSLLTQNTINTISDLVRALPVDLDQH